jgi:hypothetical protein
MRLYGIGASISVRKQWPTIVYTLPKSPACDAGLKPGDVIVQVDSPRLLVPTLRVRTRFGDAPRPVPHEHKSLRCTSPTPTATIALPMQRLQRP